jgi:hypothetical protein
MSAYEGCYVTIEVPNSFELDEEQRLRVYYDYDLPGIGVRVEYLKDITEVRLSALTIDRHAYVRTAKAAKEWKGKSQASQLQDDPFPVVVQAVIQTLNRFVRKAPL